VTPVVGKWPPARMKGLRPTERGYDEHVFATEDSKPRGPHQKPTRDMLFNLTDDHAAHAVRTHASRINRSPAKKA